MYNYITAVAETTLLSRRRLDSKQANKEVKTQVASTERTMLRHPQVGRLQQEEII
jgi:hypothetical protein